MEEEHFVNYLGQITTQERKLVFRNAIEVLTRSGLKDHSFWIDQLMEEADPGDTSDWLLSIEEMLNGAIHSLLEQFGIKLDANCSLEMSTQIFSAILTMDNWSDKTTLSSLAEMDETAEVILAEMIATITSNDAAVYLPHLTFVDRSLIDRIDEVCGNSVYPGQMPTAEEEERARHRVAIYFQTYSAPILSQAISEMLLLGADYNGLLSNYEPVLQPLEKEAAINELVGFALASDLPDGESLKKAIAKEAQGWYDGKVENATIFNYWIEERLKTVGAL